MKRSSLQDHLYANDKKNPTESTTFYRYSDSTGLRVTKSKYLDFLEKTLNKIKEELIHIDIGSDFHLGPFLFIEISKIGENSINKVSFDQFLLNDKIRRLHRDIESLFKNDRVFEFIGNSIKTFPIRFFSGYYSQEEVFKTLSGIIFMLEFWKSAFKGNNLVQWDDEPIEWWVSFCKNSRIDEPEVEDFEITSHLTSEKLKKAIELKLCCFSV
jgi:hypothetical protein